jgi:hypothetical protein
MTASMKPLIDVVVRLVDIATVQNMVEVEENAH